MEIIVPATKLITQFFGDKPKFMLHDYAGKSMLFKSLEPYLNKYKIHIGILAEHEQKFNLREFIQHEFGNLVNLVILPEQTLGPADTVGMIMELAKIPSSIPILVKDCDSFFNHEIVEGNYVCVSTFSKKLTVNDPVNKSYVLCNDTGFVQKISENQVLSDTYCVGGYKFQRAHFFRTALQTIKYSNLQENNEIFVSDVVRYMISNEQPFFIVNTTDYIDMSTMHDWLEYNNKPVVFCDIDGTIIKHQQRYGVDNYNSVPVPLINNISAVLKMQDQGSQIIFTTARPESVRDITHQMLKSLGFNNFQLLMNLNNTARILINDYNELNPYPRATAINIERNSDNLSDFL